MPAYYVYILKCIDSKGNVSYYTGSTKNLLKRFQQHQKGEGARYTKGKKLKMVHYETYTTLTEARRREAAIKKWPQARKIELIKEKDSEKKNGDNGEKG